MTKSFAKNWERFDEKVIYFLREYGDEIGRAALFTLFFWFGILKVFLVSPAGPLVEALQAVTFWSAVPTNTFMIVFGLFEVALGIMILFPKLERPTFALMGFHLITTVMPLFMLPAEAWYQPFVPTLVGQYIIKNAALLSLGLLLFARLRPMTETHSIVGEEVD